MEKLRRKFEKENLKLRRKLAQEKLFKRFNYFRRKNFNNLPKNNNYYFKNSNNITNLTQNNLNKFDDINKSKNLNNNSKNSQPNNTNKFRKKMLIPLKNNKIPKSKLKLKKLVKLLTKSKKQELISGRKTKLRKIESINSNLKSINK